MMYESPIKMIVDDITEKIVREQEDYIVKCVQNIGVSVDKAELKRALAYDRQQYDKGFADGYAKAKEDVVRCKDCKWYGRADKRRFYRGMDCLQKRIDTIIPDKDFCSKAERREE